MIRAGRVLVNGRTASLGEKVDIQIDEITVDGAPLILPAQHRYIKLHKPSGYLTSTRSQGGNPTIYTLIAAPERLFPVGRLDMHSEGLLLLTDDGELAQRLTHPSFQHEKEYIVLFEKAPTQAQIAHWHRGVRLPDGYKTQPSPISIEGHEQNHTWCRVTLREGRKRQIRTMASVLGLKVLRLVRIRIASLELGSLAPGSWQDCTDVEVEALMSITAKS